MTDPSFVAVLLSPVRALLCALQGAGGQYFVAAFVFGGLFALHGLQLRREARLAARRAGAWFGPAVVSLLRRFTLRLERVLSPSLSYALFLAVLLISLETGLSAGAMGPWEGAVLALCNAFFGPIGIGLSLIAIVIGGLLFAFGEGGSKSQIAGLIFGAGLVMQAPQFLDWLGVSMTLAACGGMV